MAFERRFVRFFVASLNYHGTSFRTNDSGKIRRLLLRHGSCSRLMFCMGETFYYKWKRFVAVGWTESEKADFPCCIHFKVLCSPFFINRKIFNSFNMEEIHYRSWKFIFSRGKYFHVHGKTKVRTISFWNPIK